jgi:hypothetical protein
MRRLRFHHIASFIPNFRRMDEGFLHLCDDPERLWVPDTCSGLNFFQLSYPAVGTSGADDPWGVRLSSSLLQAATEERLVAK